MIDIDPKTKSTEEKAARLTPEQAAILASASKVESDLSGQVQHDENGNLIEAQADQGDPIAENRDLLTMLVAMATPAMPFLPTCYTPEVINNIATAFSAVEAKYGWNVRSMIGPELGLALFAIPPTIGAVVLGRAHFANLKAQREAAQVSQAGKEPLVPGQKDAIGA